VTVRFALALRIFESDAVRFVHAFLPSPLLFLSIPLFPNFHLYFLEHFLFYTFFLFLPFVLFHFLPLQISFFSLSFRSVFTCFSRSLKLTARPQAVTRLRLYAVTVCAETTSRLFGSLKFPVHLIFQRCVDQLMHCCHTCVEANRHALRSEQGDRSPCRRISRLENCMVIPVTSLLDVT